MEEYVRTTQDGVVISVDELYWIVKDGEKQLVIAEKKQYLEYPAFAHEDNANKHILWNAPKLSLHDVKEALKSDFPLTLLQEKISKTI